MQNLQEIGNIKGFQGLAANTARPKVAATKMSPLELFSLVDAVEPTQKTIQQSTPLNEGLAKQQVDNTSIQQIADIWGRGYQTENDPQKKAQFIEHYKQFGDKAPQAEGIAAANAKAIQAFGEEIVNRGYTPEFMDKLLKATAAHESLGGKYTKQLGGGPARSWYQVEPDTAYDNIHNFGHALGEGFEQATGYSRSELEQMSKPQIANLLESDPGFASSMAALKYIRTMGKNK